MVRCYLQFFQKAFLYKDYSHGTDKLKLGRLALVFIDREVVSFSDFAANHKLR